MRVFEDGVWRYYNCPDPLWSEKCRLCREKVAALSAPVRECIDCWKVEIWKEPRRDSRGPEDGFTRLVDSLMASGLHVVAKASRAPILVVRTGVPPDAYPSVPVAYLLMLYANSISDRDVLRRAAEGILISYEGEWPKRGLRPEARRFPSLPVRRGCWRYDDVLGPWQSWYPQDRDYGE